jgi:hypothetical protein
MAQLRLLSLILCVQHDLWDMVSRLRGTLLYSDHACACRECHSFILLRRKRKIVFPRLGKDTHRVARQVSNTDHRASRQPHNPSEASQ